MGASNALWMAIESDTNDIQMLAESPLFFQIVENLFCVFFLMEWLMRCVAFKRKCDGLRDRWFVFDGVLALLGICDTLSSYILFQVAHGGGDSYGPNSGMLRLLRLLRLTRMCRVVKILRAFPELMILIKGMFVAMRSVLLTLVLLFVIIYMFA